MGYNEFESHRNAQMRELWAGWFPGRNHNDIPGQLGSEIPIGSPDCDGVAWYDGQLNTMFGYEAITTAALNGGASVNSLFYSQSLNDVVGTAGAKIYKGLDEASPVDITGSVVISSSALIDWTEYQLGTDSWVIGVDGTNPPFKWEGTGNAAVLAGSPPTGKYVTYWQNVCWMAVNEKLFFSAIGDPESWDPLDNYVFDNTITGLARLNRLLVVFFEDHIGILSGDNNRQLIKHDRFIDGVGCSSHFTISNARLNNQDVLVFHSYDGIYAFDGSQTIIKLSEPLDEKYDTGSSVNRWNFTRLDKAVAKFDPAFDWYFMGISDGASTKNDFMLISDMNRPFQLPEGLSVPHWPNTSLPNQITSMEFTRTLTKRGDIIFGSDDGIVYKLNPSVFNRAGSTYDSYWKSKVFDVIKDYIVQEINVLGDQQNVNVDVFLNPSLIEGDGDSARINFSETGDQLDIDFILDESQLGGQDYLFKNAAVANFGRFLQFKVENVDADDKMVVIAIDLVLNEIGHEVNVGN